ncbi:4a-hydroxytetrahydrobiopterin dehydratase [Streptomyces sp. 3MP-14]|uniref:Putative pterin-4-alpha-carbinolamine dehydratase n=1 Tax=Streptomyces mimosae TaxID=2586635 RepID=A0A5N6AIX7_9ACTN|nr:MULTISPECIES: 4a-hydroxytetrahydrobiopterin dehydratase [Streptomyces]KAB8167709.1 4a-hydroxytetrahydrobiopterin dehydratase [Streptomyces mimosae]KAB8177644.1 4a-hydroxytetrahydrobiopterin dehydratase [Streptomyces sp. 3MP-14]
MAPQPLNETQIGEVLSGLPGWAFGDDRLVREYTLDSHLAAVALLVHIATLQEQLDHHANLTVTYNQLGVAVNTHSVGGLVTELDTQLATRIEEIAAGHGAR